MRFALSAEDIEARAGPLGPRVGPTSTAAARTATATEAIPQTRGCGVYDERPSVCRSYSCEHDRRIWNDFEAMELNHEWIAEHLRGDELRPVELFMDAYAPS